MTFFIQSLATATPKYRIEQGDAAQIAESISCENDRHRRILPELYRRTGVQHRHSVLLELVGAAVADTVALDHADNATTAGTLPDVADSRSVTQSFFEAAQNADDCGPTLTQRMQMFERHSPDLAVAAAKRALSTSPWRADEITHLITVSCTGFAAPGIDLALIQECQLNPTVERTSVGFMGCHGAINGLRVAKAFADADPDARVLLCAVELCTLHQQYGWHPDRIVSNSLFADGAAAVIGSGVDASPHGAPRVRATGSTIIPDTEELMTWFVRDHGFEMSLSPQVPDVIQKSVVPWLSQWLAQHGLTTSDIGSWAVHPGGPRILRACQQALGFRDGQLQESYQVLAEFGNMSSATVLFILERLLQKSQSALPCVMLAFGPGLAIEAALVV